MQVSPPSPRAEALPAGMRLGDAILERLLARGEGGTLYAARHVRSAAPLAVKVPRQALPGSLAAPSEAGANFLLEARNASRLQHPHIVRVFDSGVEQGLFYLVMELLPGVDLSSHTRRDRLLPEALALELAAQLADALAYAHRQGIVHRDVKPANVMFDAASATAKLTDFGIARALDAEATRSGMLLGSPAYMAPELLAGARADARSDLYALGVLLFELLTARLPFEGESMGALLRAMATQRPQAVRALRPELAPERAAALDTLLGQVLVRAPAARADAVAWAQALRSQAQHWT